MIELESDIKKLNELFQNVADENKKEILFFATAIQKGEQAIKKQYGITESTINNQPVAVGV